MYCRWNRWPIIGVSFHSGNLFIFNLDVFQVNEFYIFFFFNICVVVFLIFNDLSFVKIQRACATCMWGIACLSILKIYSIMVCNWNTTFIAFNSVKPILFVCLVIDKRSIRIFVLYWMCKPRIFSKIIYALHPIMFIYTIWIYNIHKYSKINLIKWVLLSTYQHWHWILQTKYTIV